MKKVFVIFGFIILFAGWYFLFVKPTPAPIKAVSEKETLQGLAKALGVKAEVKDSQYIDWNAVDGKTIPLKSKQIILGTNGTYGIGKYGPLTSDDLMQVNGTFLNPLAEKIKKYYVGLGFTPSPDNTNSKPNDLWFKNLGFSKGDVFCVNNLARQSDPFAYLSCGTVDQKQVAYQTEFRSIYDHVKSQSTSPVRLIFRVERVDGDFAFGTAASVGGWSWMAKRINGKWSTIWEGQEIATCQDMQKFSVPKAIYLRCFNTATQQVVE